MNVHGTVIRNSLKLETLMYIIATLECVNKLRYSYTVEYLTALKMNILRLHKATWMNVTNMLTVKGKTQNNNTYHMVLFT